MKKLLFFIFLAPTIAFVNPNLNGITKAISNGDAAALSQFFDDSVEIAILDEEDIYDKSEAVAVVEKFFAANKPSTYKQVHQGTSKGKDSQYSIGNLKSGGNSYRVYIYLSVKGEKYIIQELRVDKE